VSSIIDHDDDDLYHFIALERRTVNDHPYNLKINQMSIMILKRT
jgi:hypothetical protein